MTEPTTQSAAVTRDDCMLFVDEAFRNMDVSFSPEDLFDVQAALQSTFSRIATRAHIAPATGAVEEAMRLVEYDMMHRAGHGQDGFVAERKEVATIITALRHRLAAAIRGTDAGEPSA